MSAVDVLIVVDTDGAASSGDLQNNVSLVEETVGVNSQIKQYCELMTYCKAGQTINWKAIPKSPESAVEILDFQGLIVQGICKPKRKDIFSGIWEGQVSPSSKGIYQYTVDLIFDGIRMTFNPYLMVNRE